DQLARLVVIIDHGRVIAAGTPDELKDRAGRSVIEVRPRAGGDLPAVEEALARIGCEAPYTDIDSQRVSAGRAGRARQPREHARPTGHRRRRRRAAPPEPRRGLPRRHREASRADRSRHRPRVRLGGRRLIRGGPMSTTITPTTDVATQTTVVRRPGAGFVTAVLQSAKRTVLQLFRTPHLLMLGTIQGAPV